MLNKVAKIKNKLRFLFRTQDTIVAGAFAISIAAGVSAVLGVLKGRFLTEQFGVSNELSVFYTADRIPNLIYSALIVGAMSAVFVPIFTTLLARKNKKEALATGATLITATTIVFVFLAIIAGVFARQLMQLLSVGQFTTEQLVLGAKIMRIMIFAQLILLISSFFTSILHSFKYFTIPALAPVLYNIGMLIGINVLSPKIGIFGPAVGTILGAILHLLIQIPLIKKVKFHYTLRLNFKDEGIKQAITLIPPRMLSVILNQLIIMINNSWAILVSTTSVILLKYASQLQFFPVNLFGASMAIAALPVLTEHAQEKTHQKFKKVFVATLHQMNFLVLPTSMILIILRIPIVRLVYGVQQFPWEATVKTSYTLAFFSLSVVAQSVIYLATRAFYALKDTATPVKISLVTVILNVLLTAFFVLYLDFGVWSIAFSYTITAFIDAVLLLYALSKKLGHFTKDTLLVPFTKTAYATLLMGISLYIPLKLLDTVVFDTTRTINLLFLTGLTATAGIMVYLILTYMLKVDEIYLFYRLLGKVKLHPPKSAVVTQQNIEI